MIFTGEFPLTTSPLAIGTTREPYDRFLDDQSDLGHYRARRMSRRRNFMFRLLWKHRPWAEIRTVDEFWHQVTTQWFLYTWPPDQRKYKVVFVEAPQWQMSAWQLYDLTVTMRGYLHNDS